MKQLQYILFVSLFFLTSCAVTEFEVTFASISDMEGRYTVEPKCSDDFRNKFQREITMSLTNTIGNIYSIELENDESFSGRKVGNVIVVENQRVRTLFSSKIVVLNGEIRKSRFDDLEFEFTIMEDETIVEDCILELELESK